MLVLSSADVRVAKFQSVRMELDRLRTAPGYQVSGVYVGEVALRAAEAANSAEELGSVVMLLRGWLWSRCTPEQRGEFLAVVAQKPFAAQQRLW